MLVLSRKVNEQIVIGEGENRAMVTLVDLRGDRVRLGIEADRSVPVMRRELLGEINASTEGTETTEE